MNANSLIIKSKISCVPSSMTVLDMIQQFDEKKMAILKAFQRRLVWTPHEKNAFLASVSQGMCASGVVVADIDTGIEACQRIGDVEGEKEYQKLHADGNRTVSEDGMQRLSTLIAFVNNEITLTGILHDLDHQPRQFENKKFESLPKDFQKAFLYSTLVVVTVKNAPWSALPEIFISLNSGCPLNSTEKRTAMQTPISQWIRTHAENTFGNMWGRFTGMGHQNIRRMKDVQLLTQAVMVLNRKTTNLNINDPQLDAFYRVGVGRQLKDVDEYDTSELNRAKSVLSEMSKAVAQQKRVPASKSIPAKTFWAMLWVFEMIHDEGYDVLDYAQLYDDIYTTDVQLESASKIQQAKDITRYQSQGYSDDDVDALTKDSKYYWRWINRTTDCDPRQRRQRALLKKFNERLDSQGDDAITSISLRTLAESA
jgi:hypothetical protein